MNIQRTARRQGSIARRFIVRQYPYGNMPPLMLGAYSSKTRHSHLQLIHTRKVAQELFDFVSASGRIEGPSPCRLVTDGATRHNATHGDHGISWSIVALTSLGFGACQLTLSRIRAFAKETCKLVKGSTSSNLPSKEPPFAKQRIQPKFIRRWRCSSFAATLLLLAPASEITK